MNIFQKIAFINRISKAWKKAKKAIETKKDLAEKVRNQINKILDDLQELTKLLPDLKGVYYETIEIIEAIK